MSPKAPRFTAARVRLSQIVPLAYELLAAATAPTLSHSPATVGVLPTHKSI